MEITKLYITRGEKFSKHPGRLSGKVEFSSVDGEVALNLDEQTSAEIVKLCADGIIRASSAVANLMTADIIEATNGDKQLENQI